MRGDYINSQSNASLQTPDAQKIWEAVSEFFLKEAIYVDDVMTIDRVLKEVTNGKGMNREQKRDLEELKGSLKFLSQAADQSNPFLRNLAEIVKERNLSMDKANMQNTIHVIKEQFDGELDAAIDAMLKILATRLSAKTQQQYTEHSSLRERAALLESKLSPRVDAALSRNNSPNTSPRSSIGEKGVGELIQNKIKTLENLSIVGIQRYPRYNMHLEQLKKLVSAYNKQSNKNIYSEQKIEAMQQRADQFLQGADLISSKGDSLVQLLNYLNSYPDKSNADYKARTESLKTILFAIRQNQAGDVNNEKVAKLINREAQKFHSIVRTNKYSDLLKSLHKDFTNNPTDFSDQWKNFSKTHTGLVNRLFEQASYKKSRLSQIFSRQTQSAPAAPTSSRKEFPQDLIGSSRPRSGK